MSWHRNSVLFIIAAIVLAFTPAIHADEVTITPMADGSIGTMYGQADDATCSNAGMWLFAGRTFFAGPRRALLAFDIASNVPAGATIDAVELTLFVDRVPPGMDPIDFGLHALSVDWGEGTSAEGGGMGGGLSSATPGDVTWVYRFFPIVTWANDGGDFAPIASSMVAVPTAIGDVSWPSTPDLVADVQGWLDNPATNFGWMLKQPNDTINPGAGEARRFFAREAPEATRRPRLRITFTPGTVGCTGDLGDANGDGAVDGGDVAAFVECATSIAIPTLPCACADVNNDTVVDVADIAMFAQLLLAGN